VASAPEELARTMDVVMLSVSDDAALDELMRGPRGVLGGLRPGTTVLDLSTVSPPHLARASGRGESARRRHAGYPGLGEYAAGRAWHAIHAAWEAPLSSEEARSRPKSRPSPQR
jgi:hypothetical protein